MSGAPPGAPGPADPLPFATKARRLALALAIGAVGGFVFSLLKLPLAWMLGAMFTTTIAALSGVSMRMWQPLRSLMIAVLGTMLGSAFHPGILDHIAQWAPSLGALFLFVCAVTGLGAFALARFAGFGRVSGFFAAAPGGLSDMALMGTIYGGDERMISLVHSVRILITVFSIPVWFRLFYGYAPGATTTLGTISGLALHDALVLGACAALGFWLGPKLRLPAPALVGPMILSAAAHLAGLTKASPPAEIVNLAQVVMGAGIGCRFVGFDLRRVFGVMAIGAALAVGLLLFATGFALGLEALTDLPFPALLLAFAPGGLAEMTLVSLSLGIDTAFVSVHHLFRMIILVAGAPLAFRLLRRYLVPTPIPGPGGPPPPPT